MNGTYHVVQATTSEGLVQGTCTYVAVRVGFEPVTLRMQGTELTTELPRPSHLVACASIGRPRPIYSGTRYV